MGSNSYERASTLSFTRFVILFTLYLLQLSQHFGASLPCHGSVLTCVSGVPRPRPCVLQSGAPHDFSHHACVRGAQHSCDRRACVHDVHHACGHDVHHACVHDDLHGLCVHRDGVLCDLYHGLCGALRAFILRYDHACVLLHGVRETLVFLGH